MRIATGHRRGSQLVLLGPSPNGTAARQEAQKLPSAGKKMGRECWENPRGFGPWDAYKSEAKK